MVFRRNQVDGVVQHLIFISPAVIRQAAAQLPDVAQQSLQRRIQAPGGKHSRHKADRHANAHHQHHHIPQAQAGFQQFTVRNDSGTVQPLSGRFHAQHTVFAAVIANPVLFFLYILPADCGAVFCVRRDHRDAFPVRQQQRSGVAFRQAGIQPVRVQLEESVAFPGLCVQRQAADKDQHRFLAQDPADRPVPRIAAQRHRARYGTLSDHLLQGNAVDPAVVILRPIAALTRNNDIHAFCIDSDIRHGIAECLHLLQFFNDAPFGQDILRCFLHQVQVLLHAAVIADLPGERLHLLNLPVHRCHCTAEQRLLLLPGIPDHLVRSPVIDNPSRQRGRQQRKEQKQNNHLQLNPAMARFVFRSVYHGLNLLSFFVMRRV